MYQGRIKNTLHKTVGIAICIVLLINVSAVLDVPEVKGNIIGKTESSVNVKLFDQEDMKYVVFDSEAEIKIPCGNITRMGSNLAPNPSFEEGDTMPTGWTYPPDTNGIYHWDSNYSYTGVKSVGVLNITTTIPEYVHWITTDFIPVDYKKNTYIFSTWIKFVNAAPKNQHAWIFVRDYDINYNYIGGIGAGSSYFYPDWYTLSTVTSFSNYVKYVKLELIQDCTYGYQPDPSVEVRFDDVYFGVWNTIPNTPTITGETTGRIRTVYNYTFSTIDPNQDKIKYEIDWGDNTTTTTAFFESGEEIIIPHIWGFEGTYTIRAKAIDEHDAESDWATLAIIMPYSKILPSIRYWMKLFDQFPHVFMYLRHFLEFTYGIKEGLIT